MSHGSGILMEESIEVDQNQDGSGFSKQESDELNYSIL